jgi:hypothetical protein
MKCLFFFVMKVDVIDAIERIRFEKLLTFTLTDLNFIISLSNIANVTILIFLAQN